MKANEMIPSGMPLEEAMEYYQTLTMPPAIPTRYDTKRASMVAGFDDYILGVCPVRESKTVWLIDEQGFLWTSKDWHKEGFLTEFWEGKPTSIVEWPHDSVNQFNYAPAYKLVKDRGNTWDKPGHLLSLASTNGQHVGLWPGITPFERLQVRSLMVYDFDTEYGKGAFIRSVRSAKIKYATHFKRRAFPVL